MTRAGGAGDQRVEGAATLGQGKNDPCRGVQPGGVAQCELAHGMGLRICSEQFSPGLDTAAAALARASAGQGVMVTAAGSLTYERRAHAGGAC